MHSTMSAARVQDALVSNLVPHTAAVRIHRSLRCSVCEQPLTPHTVIVTDDAWQIVCLCCHSILVDVEYPRR
jgi:hypothetical protein